MPELARFADRLGIFGLYLFALTAWVSKKPATVGLVIVVLACLLDARRLWQASRRSPLFWISVLVAVYVAAYAVIAGTTQPDRASYHREDALALIYLCGFILIGWCLAASERRILIALGLMLLGFVIGRLEHVDWTLAWTGLSWWQQRQKLGFASEIAFGQYAALAVIGMSAMTPRFWRFIQHWRLRSIAMALWLAVLALAIEGIFLAQSKGVVLALAVWLPLLVLFNGHWLLEYGGKKLLAGGLAIVIVLGVFAWLNSTGFGNRLTAEKEVYSQLASGDIADIPATEPSGTGNSVGARIHMWRFGLEQWQQAPLLGYGPGVSKPLIASRGDASFSHFNDLHSGYIEIPLRLGVTGLLLYATGLWFLFAGAWRAFNDGRLSRDLFIVLGSAVALHLLVNATNFRMLNADWRFYWLLFAGALATFSLHDSPSDKAIER